jgi:hypothetical protein
LFSIIGSPHADDSASIATGRPGDDDHPLPQFTNGDEPALAVYTPLVLKRDGTAFEHTDRVSEVQASLSQCDITLGSVKLDSRRPQCIDNNLFVNTTTKRAKSDGSVHLVAKLG